MHQSLHGLSAGRDVIGEQKARHSPIFAEVSTSCDTHGQDNRQQATFLYRLHLDSAGRHIVLSFTGLMHYHIVRTLLLDWMGYDSNRCALLEPAVGGVDKQPECAKGHSR